MTLDYENLKKRNKEVEGLFNEACDLFTSYVAFNMEYMRKFENLKSKRFSIFNGCSIDQSVEFDLDDVPNEEQESYSELEIINSENSEVMPCTSQSVYEQNYDNLSYLDESLNQSFDLNEELLEEDFPNNEVLEEVTAEKVPEYNLNRRYECSQCSKEFTNDKGLKIHHKLVHAPKNNKVYCKICEYVCSNERGLGIHMNFHKKGSIHNCRLCGQKLSSFNTLMIHLKTHEENTTEIINHNEIQEPIPDTYRLFACQVCSYSTTSQERLTQHLKLHKPKMYQCYFCPKTFTKGTNLCTHHKTHAINGRYKCNDCHWSFKSYRQLKYHIGSHIQKKFKAEIQHKLIETASWTNSVNKCSVCGKKFFLLKSLKLHLRKHAELQNIL